MKAMMEELAASGLSEEEILEKTQVSQAKFLQLNPDTAAKNLHLMVLIFLGKTQTKIKAFDHYFRIDSN